MEAFLHPDTRQLAADALDRPGVGGRRFAALTAALGRVLDDYSLVRFVPLDITDDENVTDLLTVIDNTIQYGEDLEVRTESLEDLTEDKGDDAGGGGGNE